MSAKEYRYPPTSRLYRSITERPILSTCVYRTDIGIAYTFSAHSKDSCCIMKCKENGRVYFVGSFHIRKSCRQLSTKPYLLMEAN